MADVSRLRQMIRQMIGRRVAALLPIPFGVRSPKHQAREESAAGQERVLPLRGCFGPATSEGWWPQTATLTLVYPLEALFCLVLKKKNGTLQGCLGGRCRPGLNTGITLTPPVGGPT